MKKVETGFNGLLVLEPKVFGDSRGFFLETFNEKTFRELGITDRFVQDNHSRSVQGTLRGLHFQAPPKTQAKLVRVIAGAVLDVVVDLRPQEPTFGKHFSVELSSENKKILYVPKGFAHGFLTLSATADFEYKCSDFYAPELERGIIWSDPGLGIQWPLIRSESGETLAPLLSEKDRRFGPLETVAKMFGETLDVSQENPKTGPSKPPGVHT